MINLLDKASILGNDFNIIILFNKFLADLSLKKYLNLKDWACCYFIDLKFCRKEELTMRKDLNKYAVAVDV